MSTTKRLRELLAQERTLMAMGAYDAFSAKLIERAGIDLAYLSGYLTSATFLGLPDVGVMTATERLAIAHQMARSVDIPVIADLEQGYGNAINVMRSVEEFERAGIAGVHLDDEVMPSKDQFYDSFEPNQLISISEMCKKIRAAVRARRDADFVIMARSDVLGTVKPGAVPKEQLVQEVIERGNAYAEAGAELIFVYAQNTEELERYAHEIDAPLVGVLGFIAPLRMADFQELGYKIVICPLPVLGAAAKGIQEILSAFQANRDWSSMLDHMISHDEIKDILSLERFAAIARGDTAESAPAR